MSLGDKQGQRANGGWHNDLKWGSGHFGEIMMFPLKKDPLNAGLFLPVRKQFPKRGSVYLQNLSIGGFGRVFYDPPILGGDVTLCHNAPWS